RRGRRPVLAAGFVALAAGCSLTALAAHTSSGALLLLGFVLIGMGQATSLLIRAAAGDMYVAARRARGISYVLSGAVIGAVLGPAVSSPMFADRKLDAAQLTVPWLSAAGIALIALTIVLMVRPDTRGVGPKTQER